MNIFGLLILKVTLLPGSWDGPPLQTALARLPHWLDQELW